ncbi:unnamed protein product [Schistosoma margrebowiei]|uniref:Uncharacterized protein n=1 Tax=Schistosoma margrebowiei TaxID=48269 RepID=A0A183MMS7_9TREM|nr:unnamed protein product [Schistosoma margrebowiei]
MPLLTTRAKISIGTWNVRTMWETGKTSQIATEMRRYNIEILGISGTHWTQTGQKRLATGETLLYSGCKITKCTCWMGISRIQNHQSIVQNKGVNFNEYYPILCTPPNDSNDDIKDQFYDRLQSIIEKCPRKDLIILIGDLNAKVGIDNTGYEDIMGHCDTTEFLRRLSILSGTPTTDYNAKSCMEDS